MRLRKRFGSAADGWWDRLPDLFSALSARWDIDLGDPVGRGNSSLVLRSRLRSGLPAIVKVIPDAEMARGEACALGSWASSKRVPALWGYDESNAALLLEAIPNETPVAELSVRVPLDDVVELIAALHRTGAPVVANGVVALTDRVDFMFELWRAQHGHRPEVAQVVSMDRVEEWYELAKALAADTVEPVLLHGDLHPWNVLPGDPSRGLVAIDPRPCIGDAAFDAVDWVIWPADDPRHWESRCHKLSADLRVDPSRVWDWCRTFAAMLAATTAIRGGSDERVAAFLAMAP